jgi:threonyl-tRNA synthetase
MPEQVIVLSVSEKYEKYAEKVLNLLENSEIRALVDNRNETVGKKIREAELNKIPYMVVVGEQEEKDGTVTLRANGGKDLGTFSTEDLITLIKNKTQESLKPFK